METPNYHVRMARKGDFGSIMSIVERDYILDEPISRSFILNRGDQLSPEEMQNMKGSLEQLALANPCLVAVNRGKVVGVLALVATKNLDNPIESTEPGGSLHELQTAVATIVKNFGLFERFPNVRKVVKLRMMAIDRDHRGQGLATLLYREAVRWATEERIDMLWSLFNSPGSRRAAEKVGFELVHEYDLLDYRDQEGRVIFAPIPEHISYMMICQV